MTLAFTWYVFDVLGTIAFALSGALVGLSKKMDVFGVIVLAVLTAVGGGMGRGKVTSGAFVDSSGLRIER